MGLALEDKVNTYLRARNFKSRLDIIVGIFGLAFVLAFIGVAMAAYLVTSSSIPQP